MTNILETINNIVNQNSFDLRTIYFKAYKPNDYKGM